MRNRRVLVILLAVFMFVTPIGLLQHVSAQATPDDPANASQPGTFQERFLSLATLMPDLLDQENASLHYADLAWRSEVIGVEAAEDGLLDVRVANGMALPRAFLYGSVFPEIGFTSTQIDRSLFLDSFGARVTLLHGRFDVDAVQTALREAGYVEEQIGAYPTFVLGGDDYMELGTDLGMLLLTGKFQYAIVLDDGLLAFTNLRSAAEQIVDAQTGATATVAEHIEIRELIDSAPEDLASVQIWSNAALDPAYDDRAHATQFLSPEAIEQEDAALAESVDANGVMPVFQWMLMGESAGVGWVEDSEVVEGQDGAVSILMLRFDNETDAANALPIVEARFGALNGVLARVPYTELMTLTASSTGASDAIAVFTFDSPRAGRLSQMWERLDMRFIYPG